jgi:hypothetical protein
VASEVGQEFTARSELTRYIFEVERHGARPAPGAFFRNVGESYLSVNLVGVEPLAQIAQYYREHLQKDQNNVAVSVHKVHEYNAGCKLTPVTLTYNSSLSRWEFWDIDAKMAPAYRLRAITRKGGPNSQSHSGVEYVRMFDELSERKFARRMARHKFHLL